jgi:hypothetical protein
MPCIPRNGLTFAAVLLTCVASVLNAADRKPLSAEEQKAFLAKRTSSEMMLGSFDAFCSWLFATRDVAIHCDSEEINRTRLDSSFPEFYKPTWRELFDAIGRQTKSTWKYYAARDFWVFSKPAADLPYKIELADKWQADDRGLYLSYHPEIAPVGMDIYMMGTYSVSEGDDKPELYKKVRDALALQFASAFKKDVTVKEMEDVKIEDLNALHFKINAPATGVAWRQWVIVDSGKAFVIVSAIKPEDEKKILPDVERMVKSFKILKAGETAPAGAKREDKK